MNYDLFDDDEMLALIKYDMKNQQLPTALEKVKYLLKKERVPVELFATAGKLFATFELFDRARFFFSEYIKNVPEAFIELFQLGMVEMDMGNYDQAVDVWKKVLEINPSYSEALYYMADAYIKLHKYDDARALLMRLLENSMDNDPYIPMADQLLNRIKAH